MNTVNKCPLLPIENVYKIYFGAVWYEPISCQNAGVWYELCRYWWHEVKNANIKQVYHYLYIYHFGALVKSFDVLTCPGDWCTVNSITTTSLARHIRNFGNISFMATITSSFAAFLTPLPRGSSGWHHHKVFASKGGVANVPGWGSRIEPENDGLEFGRWLSLGKGLYSQVSCYSNLPGVLLMSVSQRSLFILSYLHLPSSFGGRVLEVFQP